MNMLARNRLVFGCVLGALAACAQGAPGSGGGGTSGSVPAAAAAPAGNQWITNGATACEKYLTPDVVAAILDAPADHPRRLSAYSCNAGNIYITLKVADIDAFRLELPMITGVHLMAGVGDGAYWNGAGAVSAVKGHDRGCDISVIGGAPRIHGAALGQKLGEICNELFALP
jgi:hypothetical protein